MEERDEMDDFLERPEPETVPEVEPERTQPEEGETGEKETAPPAVEKTPRYSPEDYEKLVAERNAFQRATLEERKKRQQLEQQQVKQEKPRFWDAEDPDAYLEQKLAEREHSIRAEMRTQYLNISEANARSKHEDYDQKFQVFSQMVQRDPTIYHQMLNQPDPAEYAYRAASRLIQMQEMGNPDEYRKKVESEVESRIRAELEQKMRGEYEQKLQAASLPGSFSEANSKNVPKGSFAGPTSLGSILD